MLSCSDPDGLRQVTSAVITRQKERLCVTLRSCVLREKSSVVPARLVEACYWKVPVSTISEAYEGVTGGSAAQLQCKTAIFSSDLRCSEYASSNQVVGGSNPSGRTFSHKNFSAAQASRHGTSRSNRGQTTRRFDDPAPGRVGRRRFSGGGPERSGGRAAQPRAQRRSGAERPKGGPEGMSTQRE